jgi:hypothetical protein
VTAVSVTIFLVMSVLCGFVRDEASVSGYVGVAAKVGSGRGGLVPPVESFFDFDPQHSSYPLAHAYLAGSNWDRFHRLWLTEIGQCALSRTR